MRVDSLAARRVEPGEPSDHYKNKDGHINLDKLHDGASNKDNDSMSRATNTSRR